MKTILEILKEDHQKLITTMQTLAECRGTGTPDDPVADLKADSAMHTQLFNDFKQAFKSHDDAEENVFYPELKQYPTLDSLVSKGVAAHHLVKVGIIELRVIPFHHETWPAKFAVVQDSILSHMQEEETLLFPQVAALVSRELLEAIGNKVLDSRAPKLTLKT